MHGSDDLSSQIELLSKYKQIKNLICVSDPSLDKPYGQQIASIVKALVEKNQYKQVVSSTSAFGKDVIPRLGGLLDVQPITDVIEIKSTEQFVRPIYAGNAICTVTSSDALKLVTVRCTSFEKSPEEDAQSIPLKVAVPEFGSLLERLKHSDAETAQDEIRVSRGGVAETLLVRLATRKGAEGEDEGYVLAFDDVTAVRQQGLGRETKEAVLSLMSVAFEAGEDGTGRVVLTLSGDGAVGIDVEAINVTLQDVTRPYRAPSGKSPSHPE